MWEGDSFPAEFLQRKASHIFLNSMIYTGWRFFQIWSNFSRILSFFFFFIGLSIFSVQLFSYGFFNTKSPIRISFFFFTDLKTVLNLEKEMAIHSSTIAWKIPWMEEHDRLHSMGSQRVGHDWVMSLSLKLDKEKELVNAKSWKHERTWHGSEGQAVW